MFLHFHSANAGRVAGLLVPAVFALAATGFGQSTSALDGIWSGSAQCRIDVHGPGYEHHETHIWTLNGTPSRQGAMRIYPGTWNVNGQGSVQKTQGAQTLKAQWVTNASRSDAPIAVFLRASDHKLVIKSWHAQLRVAGGVTGSQQQSINGVAQRPGVLSLEAFEWAFPGVEDAGSSTTISGSSTKPTTGSVGPMQPGGSQGTAVCTWQYQRKASRAARPSKPTSKITSLRLPKFQPD